MTREIIKLKKMRAGAREKVLANDPELRKAWEEAQNEQKSNVTFVPDYLADENGMFTFQCDECGNVFKAIGRYAKCNCCGEDTHSMVHIAMRRA